VQPPNGIACQGTFARLFDSISPKGMKNLVILSVIAFCESIKPVGKAWVAPATGGRWVEGPKGASQATGNQQNDWSANYQPSCIGLDRYLANSDQ
jgi:hypothetical protein